MKIPKMYDLPIRATFEKDGSISQSDYWDTEMCQRGFVFMYFIDGFYSLCIPNEKHAIFNEVKGIEPVIITKGQYKTKEECYEIMFDDGSENPYMMILEPEQVFFKPSNEFLGWKGKMNILAGSPKNIKLKMDKLFYRIGVTLPCLQPVNE